MPPSSYAGVGRTILGCGTGMLDVSMISVILTRRERRSSDERASKTAPKFLFHLKSIQSDTTLNLKGRRRGIQAWREMT